MSKEIWDFERGEGKSAYMAGVVDVLSDRLGLVCDYGFAFEADIIGIENGEIENFLESFKERLRNYQSMHSTKDWEEKISKLDFSLQGVGGQNVEDAIYRKFQKMSSCELLKNEIKEFCDSIQWYIGKPKMVYEMKELGENGDVLAEYYLEMIFDTLFVEYEGFVVVMFWGTAE